MATFQLPRGPISYGKSGNADISDEYTRDIMRWRDAARDEAISTLQLNPEYAEVSKYIDWLCGQQWPGNRPKYRSKFFDNRLMDTRRDTLSLLTDIRPTIDVSSSVAAYKEQAEIAQKIIHHEWTNQQLDLTLMNVVDHALFNTGYWKLGAVMPGKMTVTSCGSDSVLPIQPGAHLQQSSAVLYRTYKSLQYFKNIWGDNADGLEKESINADWVNSSNEYVRPGHIAEYTWNSMSPALRYHLGIRSFRRSPTGSDIAFPVIALEEYWVDDPSINESSERVLVKDPNLPIEQHNWWYWVEPGERLFPRKRHLVFGGDRLMHDGPSPYWHGLFPFAALTLNPVAWAPGGLSKYRDLLPLNAAINHIGAGTLDVVEKALKPQMITKDGAVRDATWNKFFPDMPGGKLKISNTGNPTTDVRYIDPPNLPQYVFQSQSGYLIPTFDRRSGKIDMQQLGKKKQVPGGDTIEQMRDAMHTPFRLESRYVEAFLRDAGIQAISNIFQFYNRATRMRLLGADGMTWEDFDFDPDTMVPGTSSEPKEDHWRHFAMNISQGSLHGASKDRDKIMAVTLARMGAISLRELYRKLEVANGDQILKELMEEHKQMGVGQMAGRAPRATRGQRTGQPI